MKFSQLATVSTTLHDADFYITRVHRTKTGQVKKNRDSKNDIGIKITSPHLDADFMYYWFMNLELQGFWKNFTKGTAQQYINVQHIKDLQLSLTIF